MTEEINPSELGAFTNNLSNKEGIKKLVSSLEGKQEKLTAGSNITISDENVISAASGKVYTAGDNIAISDQDVISATDTKYTAGTNIEISEQNVISATDTKYTAGTGISISDQNVISASGGSEWTKLTGYDWSDLFEVDGSSNVIAKKDISITLKTQFSRIFIPKGYTEQTFITLFFHQKLAKDSNRTGTPMIVSRVFYVSNSSISTQTIAQWNDGLIIDFDNKTVSSDFYHGSSLNKTDMFDIYYK